MKTPEAQEAFGAEYLSVVRERRLAAQEAEEALGASGIGIGTAMSPAEIVTLRDVWANSMEPTSVNRSRLGLI